MAIGLKWLGQGRSNRFSLAVAAIGFGAVACVTYQAVGSRRFSSTKELARKDSPIYLRDALCLQHKLFSLPGSPEEFLARSYQDFDLPNTHLPGVRCGDKILISLLRAVLLQITRGNIFILFHANIVMLALAGGLVTYVAARELGVLTGLATIACFCLISTGITIPTLLLEPALTLFLTALPFGAWLVLRRSGAGWPVAFLAMVAMLGMLLKSNLQPFSLSAGLLCGWSLSVRLWKRPRARAAAVVGAILFAGLLKGFGVSAQAALQKSLNLDESAMRNSGAYALWMGSLPTQWTGAYSGRTNIRTFRFLLDQKSDPEYRRQGQTARRYGTYYIPIRKALPFIVHNYAHFPVDALKRIAFRHTKMMRANWSGPKRHVLVAYLAMLGSVGAVLAWRATLLPWVFSMHGMVWIHALSRYRPHHEEQLLVLTALLAALGLACLASFLSRLWRRDAVAPPSPPPWIRWPLAAVILLPLGLAMVFPDTQSSRPPTISNVSCRRSNEDAMAFHVRARLDAPYLNGYLEFPVSTCAGDEPPVSQKRFAQADEHGWIQFDISAACPEPLCCPPVPIVAWSLTAHHSQQQVFLSDSPHGDRWRHVEDVLTPTFDFKRTGRRPLPDGWNLVWAKKKRRTYNVVVQDPRSGRNAVRLRSPDNSSQYFFTGVRGFSRPPGPLGSPDVPVLQANRWYRLELVVRTAQDQTLVPFAFLYDDQDQRKTYKLGRMGDLPHPTRCLFFFKSGPQPMRYRIGMRLSGRGPVWISDMKLFMHEPVTAAATGDQ